MSALNVLYLQKQPCIRAIKLAAGLKTVFPTVNVSMAYMDKSPSEFYGVGDEYFDKLFKLESGSKMGISRNLDINSSLVSEISSIVSDNNFSLIHSHNWPDYLTIAALMSDSAPVIHDTHDVGTLGHLKLKKPKTINNEYIANVKSTGRIFVTSGVSDYLTLQYDFPKENNLIFNNFVPEFLIPKKLVNKLSANDDKIHLVYEGNVSNVTLHHYNIMNIFDNIVSNNTKVHLHMFVARINEASDTYKLLASKHENLHFHGKKPSKYLLNKLPEFDFGLALFNNGVNQMHLDTVLANKVLEYISCGLPVLSFPDKTQKEFIEENSVGLILDRNNYAENLADKLSNKNEIKQIVLDKRFDFSVEANIKRLYDFYLQILG